MAAAHDTALAARRASPLALRRCGSACYIACIAVRRGALAALLLDRHIVREMVAPTGIGLPPSLRPADRPDPRPWRRRRSADLTTILRVFLNLFPSILAITIPMAFLLGVLLAFGRLASDSEIIALRAVGVSPLRLLSPVLMLASVMTAITFYINAVALPAANQSYREIVFSLAVSKARTDVKPRTFSEKVLPDRMMLYVQDVEPGGSWKNLLIYDTRDIAETKLILAQTGDLVVDRERQTVRIELGAGSQHSFFGGEPRAYNRTGFGTMGWDLPVDEFFPDRKKLLLAKGDREMSLPELQQRVGPARAAQPRSRRFAVGATEKFDSGRLPGVRCSGGIARQPERGALAAFAVDRDLRLLRADSARRVAAHRPAAAVAVDGAPTSLGVAAVALLYLNHEAAFDPSIRLRHPTVRRSRPPPAPTRPPSARPWW